MTCLLLYGAELGYVPNWITAGGFTVTHFAGYSSGQAIRANGGTITIAFAQAKPNWPNPTEFYLRARLYSSGPTSSYLRFRLQDQNDDTILSVSNFGGDLYDSDGALLYDGAPGAWFSATFRLVELYVNIVAGTCIAKIAGSEVFNGSGNFAPNVGSYLNHLELQTTSPVYIGIDDLCINDPNGSVNNSWIGNSHTVAARPNAVGTYSQWTPYPGAGEDNFENVDETGAPDTDDYVQATLPDIRDSYNFEAPIGNINAVSLVPYTKMSSPGEMQMTPFALTSGSLETSGSNNAYTPGDSFASPVFMFSEAPDGAWTYDKLASAEFGFISSGS